MGGPARRRRSDEIDLDKAIEYVEANFGSWFPDKPDYAAPGHGVRFVVRERPHRPSWGTLRCPAPSLHLSVATILSVRQDYGTPKDLI